MTFIDVEKIAQHFIAKSRPDRYSRDKDLLDNYKLQKILYVSQGFHMLLFGRPLFAERILAHAGGPVVSSVWHKYKQHYNNNPFDPHAVNVRYDSDRARITPIPLAGTLPRNVELYLDDIWSVFGRASNREIERMLERTGHAHWYDKINTHTMPEIPMYEINTYFDAHLDVKRTIELITKWRRNDRQRHENISDSYLRYGFQDSSQTLEVL